MNSIPVKTIEISHGLDLLKHLPESKSLAWIRGGDGIIGIGEFERFEVSGGNFSGNDRDRFAQMRTWWQAKLAKFIVTDDLHLSGTGPIAFISASFDPAEKSVVVIPKIIIGQRNGKSWLTWIGDLPKPEIVEYPKPEAPLNLSWEGGALEPHLWESVVAKAVERITAGELDKVVLARDLTAHSDLPFDARHIMLKLAEKYSATWVFNIDGLVGATPELLLRLNKGLVTSRVLAGTIQRTGDDEHDLALAGSLARSSKDLEEHKYAVQSVTQSLMPFCSSTNIPESPFVLHLANVMHLATDVTGVISDSLTPADLFALAEVLHPSAAVCGTPREIAKKVISDLEGMNRGRYAGPAGWIDSRGEGELGIALRCAQIDPNNQKQIRLFAGCGIVAGSDPKKEYAESQAKLLPIREALESH
ncbi:MAG: isochorismate synthase [Candidatus Nanopelagicaceae bacterium]|nr:isochorismate synthase [Candidatus Nanopelagicaceae bacterium]